MARLTPTLAIFSRFYHISVLRAYVEKREDRTKVLEVPENPSIKSVFRDDRNCVPILRVAIGDPKSLIYG
jgi:hypothetical protein